MVMFDSRIGYLSSQGKREALLCYREVVAEALSDFKAKLPDESPKSIAALLVFADGRQEGSKYPNFMLSSNLRSYGL